MGLDRGGGGSPYAYSTGTNSPDARRKSNNSGLFDFLAEILAGNGNSNNNSAVGGIGPIRASMDAANRDAAQARTQKGKPKIKNVNAQTAQLDPRLQALLDERNRGKKHMRNYKKAAKHYGGSVKIPKIRKGGNRAPRQSDNITDYLESYLSQKMATAGATFDYEKALKQSANQIREAYKRDIKAIRSSNVAARKDTAANRRDVEALYNALAASYAQEADDSIASGQELANMMQSVVQDSQNNLAELSSGIANEQSELLKGLGVEEAAEAFMPQQAENTQEQLAAMAASGTEDANRQLGYAGNQQRWMDRGAQNAKLAGTNESAELLGDLQDYIQGNRSEIANLKSMRGREIASTKSDIMNSVAEQQAAADEALWDQLMGFSNLKLDIEDTQADNDLARRKHRTDIREGNRDARQWAAEMGLDLDKFRWDKKMDVRELAAKLQGGVNDEGSPLPNYLQDFNQYLGQLPPRLRSVAGEVVKTKPFTTGIHNDTEAKREFKMTPGLAAEEAKKYAMAKGIRDPQKLNMIAIAAMIYAEGGI